MLNFLVCKFLGFLFTSYNNTTEQTVVSKFAVKALAMHLSAEYEQLNLPVNQGIYSSKSLPGLSFAIVKQAVLLLRLP